MLVGLRAVSGSTHLLQYCFQPARPPDKTILITVTSIRYISQTCKPQFLWDQMQRVGGGAQATEFEATL